jgi:diguanylate cyclase (GGDEF)-like protein
MDRVIDPAAHRDRVGLGICCGGAALIATTVWLLPGSAADHATAGLVGAAMATGALAWRAVRARFGHSRGILGYPLVIFTALACLGCLTPNLATSYTGLFTIAFIFVGLYAPSGSTAPLLVPAVGCWLLANGVLAGGPLRTLEVRLPVALAIWACTGGLVSLHAQATSQAAAYLRRETLRDPLTSLRNRRSLDVVLEAAVPGDVVALLDIDRFKEINDDGGHAAGDLVLIEFARLMSRSIRDQDLAIRFGGDEFLIYLPDTTLERAAAVITRIRTAWAEQHGTPTFSAGLATVRIGRDGTDAFGEADRFLYMAKAAGRNQTAGPAMRVSLPAPRDPVGA